MKQAGWIVAFIVLLSAAMLVHSELGSMDEERQEWRAKQDSLLRGWDASRSELTAQRDSTNAIRKERDSIADNRETDTVYIERAWRRVRLMDINAKWDSLKSK